MVVQFQGGDEGGGTDKLNMKNLGGVFVVLCFGCLLAFVMGLVRWFVNVKQMSRNLEVKKIIFIVSVNWFMSTKDSI